MDARLLVIGSLAAAMMVASSPAAAQEAEPSPRPHHVGLQLGVFDNSADVLALGGHGVDPRKKTFYGAVNYRYSISPSIDLALHAGHWIGQWTTPTAETVELASGFVGPGVRVRGSSLATGRRIVPYLQANIYAVQEQSYFEQTRLEGLTANGLGIGLMGGLDVALGGGISIPIEAIYLATTGSAAADDLSGFGVSIGVDFSF